MSEPSPSADPTPSPRSDPPPWAPPDPGAWSAAPGHAPPTGFTAPDAAPLAQPIDPASPTNAVPATPNGWVAPSPQSPYGQPWPYAHPPAPRPQGGRRSLGPIVAVAVVAVLVVCGGLGATALVRLSDPPRIPPVAEQPYPAPYQYETEEPEEESPWASEPALTPSAGSGTERVIYQVTGEGWAELQYYDANGDLVQIENASLPWRLSMTTRNGSRLMVIATQDVQPSITCQITVNGKTVDRQSAVYEYGTSCFGSAAG
ncbi:MmpS family transport accessory protein [Micromonospora sp. NPDC023737]|uniref:MmpS family transport accessory protein n=1 Tax=unclassified Micromonospora TaxID=2617518 RepID=UPI0033C2CE01